MLVQTLESVSENAECSFNELSSKTKLPVETVKKYLYLIKHLQNWAPLINIKGDGIKVMKKSSSQNLDYRERTLLTLFYSKALQESTAVDLLNLDATWTGSPYWNSSTIQDLVGEKLARKTENGTFYLTDDGKRRAFRTHRKNMDRIYEDYLKKVKELIKSED